MFGFVPGRDRRIRAIACTIVQVPRRIIGPLVGVVPQADAPVFSFTVCQMVEMGRAAHLGWMAAPGAADRDIASAALVPC